MLIYLAGPAGHRPGPAGGRDGRRREQLAAVPPDHLPAARPVHLLPADHEHHLLVPGVRHRLGDDRRAARTTPPPPWSPTPTGSAFDEHGPQQLGYGAAVGIVIYLITLVVTIVQWRCSRNRDRDRLKGRDRCRSRSSRTCSRTPSPANRDAPPRASAPQARAGSSGCGWLLAIVITLVDAVPAVLDGGHGASPAGRAVPAGAAILARALDLRQLHRSVRGSSRSGPGSGTPP